MPVTRFADDACGGDRLDVTVEPRGDKARTLAGRGFLLNGADDDDADVVVARPLRADARRGCHKCRQRPFCVDAAAAVQQVTLFGGFNSDRNVAGNRVDVPEQHDRARRTDRP